MRKRFALLMLAGLIAFSGGCSRISNISGNNQERDMGEDISIFSYKPDNFCPIASNNEANLRMLGVIYEGLISLDDQLRPEACLARDWSLSEDGLVWTLNLRDDVYWHSGEKLTADDVIYTIESIKNIETGAYKYNVSNISKTSRINDNALTISLNTPCANFVNLLYFPIIKKDSATDLVEFKADGTGPYKFDGRNEGNIYYLERNENWWGGKAQCQTIKVRMLPGGDTALYAFSSSSIDLVPADNMDWGKFVDPGTSSYKSFATPIYNFLGINHKESVLKHTELREAVSLIIDRRSLVKDAVMGYAQIANTPIRDEWFVYGDQRYEHKTDTEKAQKLLTEHSWKIKENVYRLESSDGNAIAEFDILINEDNTKRENIARMISDSLDEFGIRTTVTRVSYDEYIKRISEGNYDAFIGSMAISADLDFLKQFGEDNMFGFGDEEMLSVMTDMQKSKNDRQLKARYAEFINLFEQLNPVVGLFFDNSVMLYSKKLNDEQINPSYFDIYKGIENINKGE